MTIYKIHILQYLEDNSLPCREFYELYEDVSALKMAWEQMNTEKMFGPAISDDTTKDWESDNFCRARRKDGKWITELQCYSTRPRTADDIRIGGAFRFELDPAMKFMHTAY